MSANEAPISVDTLAEWLHQRFGKYREGWTPWVKMGDDDRSYWEHEAAAVRRAVARGGFKVEL